MIPLQEQYNLYLEGLANEVMHILQRHRKNFMQLDIMDKVDVWLVQSEMNVLTSALSQFSEQIKERIRIINFYPNKPCLMSMQSYTFTCSLGHEFTFELYMRKRDNRHGDNEEQG